MPEVSMYTSFQSWVFTGEFQVLLDSQAGMQTKTRDIHKEAKQTEVMFQPRYDYHSCLLKPMASLDELLQLLPIICWESIRR